MGGIKSRNKLDKLEDLEYKLEHLTEYKRKCEEQAEITKIVLAEIKREINQLERETTYEQRR